MRSLRGARVEMTTRIIISGRYSGMCSLRGARVEMKSSYRIPCRRNDALPAGSEG